MNVSFVLAYTDPRTLPRVSDSRAEAGVRRRRLAGEWVGQLCGKVVASAYVELLEGVSEVCFHGSLRDVEALGDLAVRQPVGREACDAKFAGGERLDAGEHGFARAPAGGEQLLAGSSGERGRGGAVGQLESLSEMVAGLDAVALAAKRRPQF